MSYGQLHHFSFPNHPYTFSQHKDFSPHLKHFNLERSSLVMQQTNNNISHAMENRRQQHPINELERYCLQCSTKGTYIENRLVKEACGHVKCRQCLLLETKGCVQCLNQRNQNDLVGMKQEKSSSCLESGLSFHKQQTNNHHISSTNASHLMQFDIPNEYKRPSQKRPIKVEDELLIANSSNVQSQVLSNIKGSNISVGSKTCSISSSDNESEVTFEADLQFKKKWFTTEVWVNNSNFSHIDEQLVWLQCQFTEYKYNALVNEDISQIVIERGKKQGLSYLQRSLSIKESTKTAHIVTSERKSPDTTKPNLPLSKNNESDKKSSKRKRNSLDAMHFNHIEKKSNVNPPEYQCMICNRQFKNRLNIRYHIVCADKSAGHPCKVCGRIFNSSSHLTYHHRTAHDGVKPYKCQFCGKTFAQSSKLKRHGLTHTGERPFKCNTCGNTFTTKYNLKEHENIHKASKPYVCTKCGAGFSDRNNLRRHESAHVNERDVNQVKMDHSTENAKLKCDFCSCQFKNYQELILHKETCNSAKRWNCQTCNQNFESNTDLEQHTLSQHSNHSKGYQLWPDSWKTRNELGKLDDLPGLSEGKLMKPKQEQHSSSMECVPDMPELIPLETPEQSSFFQEDIKSNLAEASNKIDPRTVSPCGVKEENIVIQENCFTAFAQVKELLQQIQGKDIFKVVNSLSSLERRALIHILKSESQLRKGRTPEPMPVFTDRSDAFSDISTGSKKKFLKRYKRQILEENNSYSTVSTGTFKLPSSCNSLSDVNKQNLLTDQEVCEDDFRKLIAETPIPSLTEVQTCNSFDYIMKGILEIVNNNVGIRRKETLVKEAQQQQEQSLQQESSIVKSTDRGLRKISVFD